MDNIILQSILDHSFALPEGFTLEQLTPALITGLGSADSDQRETCYEILNEWIMNGTYSAAALREMGAQMACNLSLGRGETNTDSVFLRSFSALVLEVVLEYNQSRAQPVLLEADVRAWAAESLAFFNEELDWRGYVPLKGWAHAAAHGADLLKQLALNRFLHAQDLEKILSTIAIKITRPTSFLFEFEEDERLASAVISALLRGELEMPFLTGWLNTFIDQPWQNAYRDPTAHCAQVNSKAFLRSLYLQILFGPRLTSQDGSPQQHSALWGMLLGRTAFVLKELDRGRFYQRSA